jgi:hypothetical protein
MTTDLLREAVELAEKANASLQPELMTASDAQHVLRLYARLEKLGAFGKVALARKLDNAEQMARVAGISLGKARETVSTAKTLGRAEHLNEAFKHGEISFDQAAEIARAEESAPGASRKLLGTARTKPFHVLKDEARALKLEAEQRHYLAERQHATRSAKSWSDPMGMVHIHLALEPHVGTPIIARAEAHAARLAKKARNEGRIEAFERHAADAYAEMLPGAAVGGRTRRPELVVLVSHSIAKRGWRDVRKGEVCKIPGVGPVPPKVARAIATDAFLNGVFYDGQDLRHFKRWTKHIPVEVQIALELGKPPDFDGVACVDCGNRFRTEFDHVEPRVAGGATSHKNVDPRCWPCHQAKTERDRKNGKLKSPES